MEPGSKTSKQNRNRNEVGVRNKIDEQGQIVRNKARLVVHGYNQEEGIDYD